MTGSAGGGGGLLDLIAALSTDPASYPQWIEDFHTGMVADTQAYLDAALAAGSPYAGFSPWDPQETIAEIDLGLTNFRDQIATLDWDADWLTGVTGAKTYYDSDLAPDISDRIASFEARQRSQLDRAYGRLGGVMSSLNMADAGASPYIMAAAILEEAAIRDLADFTAQLELQSAGARISFVSHAGDVMLNELSLWLSMHRELIGTNIEVGRVRSVLNRDYINDNIQLEVSDRNYELGLFQYGSNLIAGLSGAALIPKGPNPIGAAISGVATGVATGASVGIVGGPTGALIGGALGGALFGAAGLLSTINFSALADYAEGL